MNIFTDPRDGEIYKTVKINGQIWLAENLRYRGTIQKFNNWTIEEKDFYYSPDGKWKNLQDYGCLYTWKNALKAVPDGWHLPSKEEYKELLKATEDTSKKLRALKWSGTDTIGFRALPAGLCVGSFYFYVGSGTFIWASTEYDSNYAYNLFLSLGSAGVRDGIKTNACSVRCIRN